MEELQMTIHNELNMAPKLLGYLAYIEKSDYFYDFYNLRHPGAIFNISTNYVIDDFIKLLDNLEIHQKNFNIENSSKLCLQFRSLVNNFFKFYDSFYEIMQGACRQHTPPTHFIHIWLKKNNYTIGQKFYNETKNNLNYFVDLNNLLKHTSDDLRSFDFYNQNVSISGYFIESVDDSGCIGPNEIIHPKYKGAYTATSYNYILRRLYYCLYDVCETFNKLILDHFNDVHCVDLKYHSNYNFDNNLWALLFNKIRNLPNQYFPNESGIEIPIVKINNDKLIFNIFSADFMDFTNWNPGMSQVSDGFTTKYRLIFMYPRTKSLIK